MALLPIVLVPDPVLRQVAKPVETITPELRRLMDDMLETMYEAPGIGLAANQVGRLERVIVMDCADKHEGEEPQPLQMVNPEIIATSQETNTYNEGCLSIPEGLGDVVRPAAVTLRYLDPDGQSCELEADGLLATCIQHEIDHLNGILFTDHLSKLKRDMVLKKAKKIARDRQAG